MTADVEENAVEPPCAVVVQLKVPEHQKCEHSLDNAQDWQKRA